MCAGYEGSHCRIEIGDNEDEADGDCYHAVIRRVGNESGVQVEERNDSEDYGATNKETVKKAEHAQKNQTMHRGVKLPGLAGISAFALDTSYKECN